MPPVRIASMLFTLIASLWAGLAHGALIQRTITIDGVMTDWTSPDNILTNNGQFSEDCDGTIAPADGGCDGDYEVSSTGRDLKTFAFTWDNNNIFLYVERFASTSNATDWWFYLDTNNSTTVEDNEPVVHVDWSGANGTTKVELCQYNASNDPAGDPLVSAGTADGYDMPGNIVSQSCVQQYSTKGGATSGPGAGVQMELAISWAALGLAGPANLGFHISSSNGTNIPNQLTDNMSGPAGNAQLFPPDMAVTKTASAASVQAGNTVTYTILLENLLYDDFTNITVDDVLPPQFEYVSHTVTANNGGTFDPGDYVDITNDPVADPDAIPEQWQLALLPGQGSATLEITALAKNVPFAINTTNTASISGSTEVDNDSSNDSDDAVVQVQPSPALTVTKVSSASSVQPNATVRFTVSVANIATVSAINVVLTDELPQFTEFGQLTFAGQPFNFDPGDSGLTMGTPRYSTDGGLSYGAPPNPGQPFDPSITHFEIPLNGTMGTDGASFQLEYDVRVR